jgi:hypothetical protein
MLVPVSEGKVQQWSIEFGGGPATFPAMGITRSNPKVGDKIIVHIHPLRDGRPGGSFVSMTLGDGSPLSSARPAGAAPTNR